MWRWTALRLMVTSYWSNTEILREPWKGQAVYNSSTRTLRVGQGVRRLMANSSEVVGSDW
jgi:hypothetical protein